MTIDVKLSPALCPKYYDDCNGCPHCIQFDIYDGEVVCELEEKASSCQTKLDN